MKKRRVGRRSAEVRYRHSPWLISYWLGPVLVFENYLKQQRIAGNPFVAEILDYCGTGKSLREIKQRFPQDERWLLSGIRRLLKCSLLEVCGRESPRTDEKWQGWMRWSPAAGYFHFSTKNSKYIVADEDRASGLRKIAKLRRLPPRVKEYPRATCVQLPRMKRVTEFPRVLGARRTWREFAQKPATLPELAELLWWSFGVQGWVRIAGVGKLVLKTSPSGGAMSPLEAYVLVRNVQGLATGIYHYHAAQHRLELLRHGISKAEIVRMLGGQKWAGEAAFVVLLSAVFARTQWKYEHARAYRVVLAEAGHQCQTFCLAATWLGLAPFCTMALADTKIEKALGIDGVSESVLYAAGAGVRPAGKATAERWRS